MSIKRRLFTLIRNRSKRVLLSEFLDWVDRTVRRSLPSRTVPLRRLFVDVSSIVRQDAQTGIQRVVRSICRELGEGSWPDLTIHSVAATKRRPYAVVATDLMPRGANSPGTGPLELGPGDTFLGLDLCAHLFSHHEMQLRRWRAAGADIAVVVYDLLPLAHPGWFNAKTARHFRRWLDVVGRRASVVLPISRTVQTDLAGFLAKWHSDRMDRIATHVLPLSGDIGLFGRERVEESDLVANAMQSRPALLMVGTIEPRKGHASALAAHRSAWAASPKTAPLLVLAGKPGWQTEALQTELRGLDLARDGAVWLCEVSDNRLDRLYRACHGVLVASLGEGYCLPLHEALAYGKPVLARDLPVLRELQTAGLSYFTRDDPVSLANAFIRFAADPIPATQPPDLRGWAESVQSLMRVLTAAATR